MVKEGKIEKGGKEDNQSGNSEIWGEIVTICKGMKVVLVEDFAEFVLK